MSCSLGVEVHDLGGIRGMRLCEERHDIHMCPPVTWRSKCHVQLLRMVPASHTVKTVSKEIGHRVSIGGVTTTPGTMP